MNEGKQIVVQVDGNLTILDPLGGKKKLIYNKRLMKNAWETDSW